MWIPPMQKIEFVTVNQMYQLTQVNEIPLLSDYTAEFWSEYLQNYVRYDRLFNRLYKNFYYFNQGVNLQPSEVQPDFTEDVYGLLLMNHKRYSELYRIHVVNDENYSIIDNYDITETKTGEHSKEITDNFGQRITNGNATTGQQTNGMVEKVAPYDSEQFSNENSAEQTLGSRTDTSQSTVSAIEDTHEHTGSDSYNLRRKGNIGVQTQSEVMKKHEQFWNRYNFYKIIFDDICSELLLIDNGYI